MADDRIHKNINAAAIGFFAGMRVADKYSNQAFDEGKVVQGAAIMGLCGAVGAVFGYLNNDCIYQTASSNANRYRATDTVENKKRSAVVGALAGADLANVHMPDFYKRELPDVGLSIMAAGAVVGGAVGYLNSILTENSALNHANSVSNNISNGHRAL